MNFIEIMGNLSGSQEGEGAFMPELVDFEVIETLEIGVASSGGRTRSFNTESLF